MPHEPGHFATAELQGEFNLELEKSLQRVRLQRQQLTPSQRLDPQFSLPLMELRARQGLVQRFQRISGVEELRLSIEAGEFTGLPSPISASYLDQRQKESGLIREELFLESEVRSLQNVMEDIGAPTVFTKAAQWFYAQFGAIPGISDPRAAGVYEQTLAQYNIHIDRLEKISTEMEHTRVYQSLYEGLGAYIQSGKVSSYEDLFTLTTEDGVPITIFEDIGRGDETLRKIFEQVSSAVFGLEGESLKELNYDEMVAKIATKPTGLPPETISSLTVSAIVRSLGGEPRPEFHPEFPTIEETLEGFSKAGVPDEIVEELEDLDSYTKGLEEYWQAISSNRQAVLQGLEEARMPEMGLPDFIFQTIRQPALTALDLFGKLYSEWIAPWGGFLFRLKFQGALDETNRFPSTEAERDFMRLYDEAIKTDDSWHAGGKAFAEAELGFLNRFLFEWVADPLTWLGFGIGKALVTVGAKGSRFAKFIGPGMNIAEKGYLKFWDTLIFDRIKGLGKFIQKTPFQASQKIAGDDMISVAKYLVAKANGVYYSRIPLGNAIPWLREARNWAIHHPEDTGIMGRAGKALLRQDGLNESRVVELGRKLGTELEVTSEMVLNVNSITNGQIVGRAGTVLTRKTSPSFLLRTLGIPESKSSLKLASKEINRLFQSGIKSSELLMGEASHVPDLLSKIFNKSHNVYMSVVESSAAHNLEMGGRVSSMLSNIEWTVMGIWRNTLDRWVVTPGARMYLAFSAYGPGNIIEGFIKQGLSRQIPFNPLGLLRGSKPVSIINPTTRGQRLMAGLSKPIELEAAIPRIEMAGETPSFLQLADMSSGGQSALKKWRSVLSGGPIGRFFIDLPGRFGVHQRWDYYRKMFLSMGIEDEVLGPVMSTLSKNIDDAVKTLPGNTIRSLGITKHELEGALLERAIQGPVAIRSFLDDIIADRLLLAGEAVKREAFKKGKKIGERAVSRDQALADRISGGAVGEAAGKYPLVPQPFTDDLIQSASDGSLWARGGNAIDTKVESYTAAMYDYYVHSPEFYKERFRERVDGILAMEAKTKEEFTGMLQELQDLQKFYGESVDDTIRAMNELEHRMRTQMKAHEWVEWRGQYTAEVYTGLGSYGDVSQSGFDDLIGKLQSDVGKHLTVKEQASVSKLFSAWTDEQRFLKDFWSKRRKDELEMLAAKPSGREAVARFWDDFFGAQTAAHNLRRVNQAPFRQAAMTQEFLTSEALGTLGFYPPTIDVTGRKLTKMDVATLFRGHPSQLPQSMLRLETMTLKAKNQFITEVRTQAEIMASRAGGKTAASMGFTDDAIGEIYDDVLREMQMSPEAASVMEPHLMELKALKDEMWNIYNTRGIAKGTADDLQVWLDDLADIQDKVPGYLSEDFQVAKQRAADKTTIEYHKDWADYTNENASTALMRTVYPFWTYELHRLFWLPRASIRTPGIFKSWGTYMDMTEDGYFHIPGTSMEVNPLRGTIFMGGMIRLIRKDYPEYYDRFPGLSDYSDFLSRYGFYPATYLNFLKVFGGKTAQGKTNWGELLPAWIKTPLNGYIAAFPDSVAAKTLLDTILAEPFRDYTTVLVANAIAQRERRTFNGMDIADKIAENLPLTEEEQELWNRAVQNHGWMGMIQEQSGVIRIRTEEQIAAWEASGKLIEELTGYTLEDQLWIRRHGFRVGDYAQLDPLEQSLLSEMDAMKYHSGIFSTLMPSTWQEEDRRRREFFGEVRSYSEARRADQEELDRQARVGEITMTQWSRSRSDLRGRNANFFEDLSETERYMNVAINMEDVVRPDGTIREGMITRAKDRQMLPPIEHPAREILNAYYSIKLEKKLDPASGNIVNDWDGYFQKIDAIINALSGAKRDDLIQIITRTMTDLEKLRWEISRRYFRGYNRRQEAILRTQFNEEEQALIMRWTFGTPAERDALQEVMQEESGKKLISVYRSMISVAGQNLRKLGPELDAWLQFFEITDTTLTEEAALLYSQFRKDWGIPE